VRQLAAAAGDGWLGSVGSPGQLETSLNSGYTVGPCNSYLEGPTPILCARCSRIARSYPPSSSSLAEERTPPLPPPYHGGRAISDARSSGFSRFRPARDLLLNVRPDARSFGVLHVPTRSQIWGCSMSDPTLPMSGTHVHVRCLHDARAATCAA